MEDIVKRIEKYNDDEDVIGAYDYEAKMRLLADIRAEEATERGLKQGLKQGLEQGIEQGKIEIAKNMLNKGIDVSLISEVTGLSIKDIIELK